MKIQVRGFFQKGKMKTFAKIFGWIGFGATAIAPYIGGKWGGILGTVGAIAGGSAIHAASKTSDNG